MGISHFLAHVIQLSIATTGLPSTCFPNISFSHSQKTSLSYPFSSFRWQWTACWRQHPKRYKSLKPVKIGGIIIYGQPILEKLFYFIYPWLWPSGSLLAHTHAYIDIHNEQGPNILQYVSRSSVQYQVSKHCSTIQSHITPMYSWLK